MTVAERIATPEVAELWIRESLGLDLGAELTVTGTCMEPVLRDGERIRLNPMMTAPRIGDVVLLRTTNGLRLHRVLFKTGATVRTKGDQGGYLDPKTPLTAVIAVWESDESPIERWSRVGLSCIRLLTRRFAGPQQTASVR